MQLTVWGLKTCDTCKKAIRALEAGGHPVRLRDVRDEPLSEEEIAKVLTAFGTAAVNRKSATWRGLDEEERQIPPQDLLARHPALMKRPVTVIGDVMHLGWGPEVQSAIKL